MFIQIKLSQKEKKEKTCYTIKFCLLVTETLSHMQALLGIYKAEKEDHGSNLSRKGWLCTFVYVGVNRKKFRYCVFSYNLSLWMICLFWCYDLKLMCVYHISDVLLFGHLYCSLKIVNNHIVVIFQLDFSGKIHFNVR